MCGLAVMRIGAAHSAATESVSGKELFVVEEIRLVVDRLSNSGGYSFVFDSAAVTAYQTPILLFNDGKTDLTEAVIKEIYATAPAGALSATEPVEKK